MKHIFILGGGFAGVWSALSAARLCWLLGRQNETEITRGKVKMKVIKIGIASQQKIRERVLAIARGEIKPKASDPKIWFTSMRSLSQVLSDENRALLDVIRTSRPASMSELADMTGRKQSNLSRTLKTMARYGLVTMENNDRSVRPVTQAESYLILA